LLKRNFVTPHLIFDNRYHENESRPAKVGIENIARHWDWYYKW